MRRRNKMRKIAFGIIAALCLAGCAPANSTGGALSPERAEKFQQVIKNVAESMAHESGEQQNGEKESILSWNGTDVIPVYTGSPYCEINSNIPYFEDSEKTTDVFENYSDLDSLGRCGVAYANICKELMPTEKRGEIGMIKPTGWHTVRYDDLIKDKYLYNRCHLIGFQLAGENANEKNLVTGTRYMNVDGMLPFENMVTDYVKEMNNHVLYRVTPIFVGNDLVCRGVEMEAWSVEDDGEGICFHVFAYDVQPGIVIDYATGDSWAQQGDTIPETGADTAGDNNQPEEPEVSGAQLRDASAVETSYILNTNSKKFHLPTCESTKKIADSNKEERKAKRDELIAEGYAPCGICKP